MWLHVVVSRRNMLAISVGAVVALPLALLLFCCLAFGLPCPMEGFVSAAQRSDATFTRYLVTTGLAAAVFAFSLVYGVRYVRDKKSDQRMAAAVTVLFVVMLPIFWGVFVSGVSPDRQLLMFASVEFLIAGFVVFFPLQSLLYFVLFFAMFGVTLTSIDGISSSIVHDITYLAVLDVAVSWFVYSLFAQSARREQTISNMSLHDELTGAKNRHSLRDDFGLFAHEDVFIMICDIDDFKHYNDVYGHDVGDYLLTQFYYALREAFSSDCVYRYGGDEFLVVSPEFDLEEFERRVRKTADQLGRVHVEGMGETLTYSGGYVQGRTEDDSTSRQMLHDADSNLLKAKAAGKNRLVGNLTEVELAVA